MKNRDLIRDAMMFAVKDITGRVLREATVQSMIDDFEKQLNVPVVSSRFDDIYTHPFRVGRKQGKAVLDAKGLQVVFMATEKQAQMYSTYLNGY